MLVLMYLGVLQLQESLYVFLHLFIEGFLCVQHSQLGQKEVLSHFTGKNTDAQREQMTQVRSPS